MDADKLSIRVAEFIVRDWFVIKLGGGVLFGAKKNEGKRRNEEERVEGHSSGYKLNITNEFIYAFNRRI